jgi:cysteine-S-conjugate beta-lyase
VDGPAGPVGLDCARVSEAVVDLSVPALAGLRQRRSEKWALFDPDVLSLTVAEMDFPIAAAVSRAVQATIERGDLGYAVPAPRGLRDALAEFAKRRLDWHVDAEQVSVVPDVMVGIVELCRTIAGPGGSVAFATPAYPPFFHEPVSAGVRTVPVALTPDGAIDLDDLDATMRSGVSALILSNPHNPTGRVLPHSELASIAEHCAEREVWVLADEIHAPLVLPGATHVPWFEVSEAARRWGIVLTSASKAFNLAALKTAFIVTSDSPARSIVERIGPQHEHASLLGEIAAEVAFREGDAWLDAVLAQLAGNRDHLDSELRERLPALSWQPPQATYLAWLDCRGLQLQDEPADVFLQRGRVALGAGLDYGEPGAGHARLNFATSPEHLSEAVARMAAALVPAPG